MDAKINAWFEFNPGVSQNIPEYKAQMQTILAACGTKITPLESTIRFGAHEAGFTITEFDEKKFPGALELMNKYFEAKGLSSNASFRIIRA